MGPAETPTYSDEDPVRWLVMGDSYVVGEGVAAGESWPEQLKAALGIPMEAPVVVAQTGWSANDLLTSLQNELPEGPFDLIILQIGVNDQVRGTTVETFHEEFLGLLNAATYLTGEKQEHVVVLSIPDWSVTPYAEGKNRQLIAEEIEAFNVVVWAEASLSKMQHVDITEISRQAAEQPELLASDGLHPSAEMYALWVEALIPQVKSALGVSDAP